LGVDENSNNNKVIFKILKRSPLDVDVLDKVRLGMSSLFVCSAVEDKQIFFKLILIS